MLIETIPFWEQILIVDERGLTLYSHSPRVNTERHTLLMGGLFMRIDTVFSSEFEDDLKEIKGVKYHVSVIRKHVNSIKLLFIGLTRSAIYEKKRVKELEFVAHQFIKRFTPEITKVGTFDNFSPITPFNAVPKTRKDTALTQISDSLQLNPRTFSFGNLVLSI